jgi:transcriptional regulator with XRE-family HTH domain
VGAYFRRQRQRATPDRFPDLRNRRRHVAHLTQADLAELAGVSISLVAQVERGRYDNLNLPLVQRLVDALGLGDGHRRYVQHLVQPAAEPAPEEPDDVPESVRSVVDTCGPSPAMVLNPRFDVLYWNAGAAGMIIDFGQLPDAERNMVVAMFCVPEMRARWGEWADTARSVVASLRMQAGLHPAYREAIHELAGDLSRADPLFARWWAEEDPQWSLGRERDVHHPRLGTLRLYQTMSEVLGSPYLTLLQFSPRDEETRHALEHL